MNLISTFFVFLGVCVVVIASITMYLDKQKPQNINDPEPVEAEAQGKKHASIIKSSVKFAKNIAAKVVKTAIPLMAAGLAIWVFTSFIAKHYGT